MNSATTQQKRILIIEDEHDFAAMLEYRLRRKGYETVKAFDGLSGVEEAARCRPDLIVLDLMLPKMDGLEVCHRIRSNMGIGHVPIWILTALDSVSHKTKGFMMGADGYFTKSNQLPDLLNQIDAMFGKRTAVDVISNPATTEFVASLMEKMLATLSNIPQLASLRITPLSEP
jgi:DNA-binding response OmpR family regulator